MGSSAEKPLRIHGVGQPASAGPRAPRLPSQAFCDALRSIGLEEQDFKRPALRSIVHASTGAPPERGISTDELAAEVLRLYRDRILRKPSNPIHAYRFPDDG